MRRTICISVFVLCLLFFSIIPANSIADDIKSYSSDDNENTIGRFPHLEVLKVEPQLKNNITGEYYAVAGTTFKTNVTILNKDTKPFRGIVILFLKVREHQGYYLDRIQYSGPVSSTQIVIGPGENLTLTLTCDVPINIRLPLTGELGVGFLDIMDYLMPGAGPKYYGQPLLRPAIMFMLPIFCLLCGSLHPLLNTVMLILTIIPFISLLYVPLALHSFKNEKLPIYKILLSQWGGYQWTESQKFKNHFGNWINFSVYVKQTEPAQIGVEDVTIFKYKGKDKYEEKTSLQSGDKILVKYTIYNKGAKETEVNVHVNLLEPSAVGAEALRAKINLNKTEGIQIGPFSTKSHEMNCTIPNNIESGFYDLEVSCTCPYIYGVDLPTLKTQRVRISIEGSMNPQMKEISSVFIKIIPIIFLLILLCGAIFIIMYFKFEDYFRKKR